eukprot:m.280029 g.280029  ORF g.280029 m.280029 type:complete len:165 (+) comp146053_c0_seq1:184-678(+)
MSWSFLRNDMATCPPSSNMHCTSGSYGQVSIRRLGHRTNNIEFPVDYKFKDTLKATRPRQVNTPMFVPYIGKDSLRSLANTRMSSDTETTTTTTLSKSKKILNRTRPFQPVGTTAEALPPLRGKTLTRSSRRLSATDEYRSVHTRSFRSVRLESVTTGSIPVFI